MQSFGDRNPIAVTVFFLTVAGISMFCMNPLLLILSLIGSLLLTLAQTDKKQGISHLYMLALWLGMTFLNPLVSHNGMTVLFVMNNNPVTLEALIYGSAAATMIVSVMYWFRAYAAMMTSDRLLYLFGAVSPKFALILSMSLRYVPLFGTQVRKISQTQKALGLYKENNIIDTCRGGLRIFSVMVTWALENGIVTADSMTARGYGIGRRSRFAIFRFTRQDACLLLLSLLLAGAAAWGLAGVSFTYYPTISLSGDFCRGITGCIAYLVLTLVPLLIEGKETIKWNCLRSKI